MTFRLKPDGSAATFTPTFGFATSSPSFVRCSKASRIGPRLIPNSSARVCSRSGVSGSSWPERIRRRRCDATCSCRLEASFIGERVSGNRTRAERNARDGIDC